MPTVKATLVYDTYVNDASKGSSYDTADFASMAKTYRIAVQQYNIPALQDVILNSAKLRLFVDESVSGATVTATLYDQSKKFSKLTYNDWIPVMDRKILDGQGTFTFSSGSSRPKCWQTIWHPRMIRTYII